MSDTIIELARAYRALAREYNDLTTDIANHVKHSAELGLTTVDSRVLLDRLDKGHKRVMEINDKVSESAKS